MASRMTLRVGKVGPDGGREFGPRRVVTVASGPTRPVPDNPCAFPPCRCPRHRPTKPQPSGGDAPRAARARVGRTPVKSMAELWAWWRM